MMLAHALALGAGGRRLPVFAGGDEWAVLGDSITAEAMSTNASTRYFHPRGYVSWSDVLSRKCARLPWANNFGVSGDRTDQMLVRVPDVIASGAKLCVVLGGTNDVRQGKTAAQIIGNLTSIYDGLTAGGVWIGGMPILPRGGANVFTSGELAVANEVNAWIRAQGSRPTFRLCDPVPDILDPALAATYEPKAGYMRDGLHPAPLGARYIGQSVANVLRSLYYDDASLNDLGSILTNPQLAGTGGTLTGVTGQVATGWTGFGSSSGGATVVCSKVTDPDGTVWQRVVVSGTYTGNFCTCDIRQDVAIGNFLAGSSPQLAMRARVAAGAVGLGSITAQFQAGIYTARDHELNATGEATPDGGYEGIFRTSDFVLASNATAARSALQITFKNTATVDPISITVDFTAPALKKL